MFRYFKSPKIFRNSGIVSFLNFKVFMFWRCQLIRQSAPPPKIWFSEKNKRAQKSALPPKIRPKMWHKINSDIPLWRCELTPTPSMVSNRMGDPINIFFTSIKFDCIFFSLLNYFILFSFILFSFHFILLYFNFISLTFIFSFTTEKEIGG